jgi:hypothetical protein
MGTEPGLTLDPMRGTDTMTAPDTADDRPRDTTTAPNRPGPRFPRLGVAAAVVLIAFLAGLAVFAVRPFASADESAHADYGLTIFQEHRLPTLFDHVDPVFPYQQAKPQHVANHPPLYYLMTGPLLAGGLRTGHLIAGYELARLVSVVASMLTVLLVAGFAHAVTRGRRPAVTVGAAALVATYAPFVSVSGVLHNDAVSVAFSTGVLWLTVLVLRRGPTWPLVAGIALVAAGAGSSKPGLIAYTFSAFVLATIAVELIRGTRVTGSLFVLISRNRRRYGGYVVHAAVVLAAIGIAGSSAFGHTVERRLALGQSMKIDGYTLTNRGVRVTPKANVVETRAILAVTGRWNGTVESGSNQYLNPPEPSQEVGIKTDWWRAQDLYVIADDLNVKTQVIYTKVLVKPLVNLLWIGGVVFLFGSLIALWPDAREQRRLVTRLAPARA